MTTNWLLLLGAGLALFLVGVNTSFLLYLGNHLTRWFTFKLLAVDLMLIYITLSLSFGNPATWRAVIGVCALVIDVGALAWMWSSIDKLQKAGVTGFIPLGKIGDDDEAPV